MIVIEKEISPLLPGDRVIGEAELASERGLLTVEHIPFEVAKIEVAPLGDGRYVTQAVLVDDGGRPFTAPYHHVAGERVYLSMTFRRSFF